MPLPEHPQDPVHLIIGTPEPGLFEGRTAWDILVRRQHCA